MIIAQLNSDQVRAGEFQSADGSQTSNPHLNTSPQNREREGERERERERERETEREREGLVCPPTP